MKKILKKKFPSVSIIFPVYNGGDKPLECLRSIYKLNYPESELEVIVIDNNSTDGWDKKIKSRFPKVKLFKMKDNLGFAKAINAGIKKSSGDFIYIGNDDIIFEKNSIKHLVNYLLENEQTGIAGGKIFQKDDPGLISSCGYMMNKWTGHIYKAADPDTAKEADWIQGCGLLISKKLLNKIGLLDENYSLYYFEDYDLCLRAKKAGYKICYLPDAVFWHYESATIGKNSQLKFYYWYKNKIRFIIKNLPLVNIISILSFHLLLIVPYRSVIQKSGILLPFIKGLYWNIVNLKQTISVRSS